MRDEDEFIVAMRRKRLIGRGLLIALILAAVVVVVLMLESVDSFDPDRFDQRQACRDFIEDALGEVAAMFGEAGEAIRELPASDLNEAIGECLTWEPELVWCLAYGDIEVGDCRRAYEQHEGLVTSTPRQQGPEVAWHTEFDVAPLDVDVRTDGTVFYVFPGEVLAIRNGEEIWRRPIDGETTGWLLDLGEKGLLTGSQTGSMINLSPETGSITWQRDLPSPTSTSYDERYANVAFDAEPLGANVLLLLNDSQIAELRPSECAVPSASCIGPIVPIDGGDDVATFYMAIDSGGERLFWSQDAFVVTTADNAAMLIGRGSSMMTLVGDPAFGPDETVSLIVDDELITFHPPSCYQGVAATVSLPPSAYDDGGDFVPDGCIRTTIHLERPNYYPPTAISQGLLVSLELGLVLISDNGIAWRSDSGVTSELLPLGDVFVFVCGAEDYESAVDLCAIHPESGELDWRSRLTGAPRSGFLVDDALIDLAGNWIAMSHKTYGAAVALDD